MGERRKRWRPWDLNRLAADIAAEVQGAQKPLPRLMLKMPRRAKRPPGQLRPSADRKD